MEKKQLGLRLRGVALKALQKHGESVIDSPVEAMTDLVKIASDVAGVDYTAVTKDGKLLQRK